MNFAWNATELPFVNTWKYTLRNFQHFWFYPSIFHYFNWSLLEKFGFVFLLVPATALLLQSGCVCCSVYKNRFHIFHLELQWFLEYMWFTGKSFHTLFQPDKCDWRNGESNMEKHGENSAKPFLHRRQTDMGKCPSFLFLNTCHKFSLYILWNATNLRHIVSIHKRALVWIK